jgi:phage/plasmid-associated DNA primase
MESTLYDLLRDVSVEDGYSPTNNYTHMTLYGPRKNWTISTSKLNEFWRGYCDIVATKPDACLSLAEKPIEQMPLIVMCRLPFNMKQDEAPKDPFQFDFILEFVVAWQQAMTDTFALRDSEIQHRCVFLREDKLRFEGEPTNMQYVAYFRMQFPHCKVAYNPEVLQCAIRHLRDRNVLQRLTKQPSQDWEGMLTLAGNDPVPMYLSTVTPDAPKLGLGFIFNSITQERINNKTDFIAQLGEVFNPEEHMHANTGLVRSTLFAEKELDFFLPMLLSVHYGRMITQPVVPVTRQVVPAAGSPPKPTTTQSEINGIPGETELEMAERFLSLMDNHRAYDEFSWRDIGQALWTVSQGHLDGLAMWQNFSLRSDYFTGEDCGKLYFTAEFQTNNKTLKTIAWYAREDNPVEYGKWHRTWYGEAIEEASGTKHMDVAKAIYRVYWLEFVNADMKMTGWYTFKGHRWFPNASGVELAKLLTSTRKEDKGLPPGFLGIYEQQRTIVARQIEESADRNERERGELKLKRYQNIIDKLKSYPFQQAILRASMQEFHDEKFMDKLDANPDTMGMMDGVVEVVEKKATHRPGKPEDFITKKAKIYYDHKMTWEHPSVQRTLKWIRQIFVDDELKEYFLNVCASFLKGRNSEKKFHVWSGESGDNSKSMIVKLLQATFGDYCVDMPVSVISGKETQSNAPTPELAQAKCAHIAIMAEPDEKEDLKGGKIKRITGGDRFFGRFLNQNGGSIENTFKAILMCNVIPAIPTGGQAMENRMEVIPFLSKWVKNAPATEEEQFAQRLFPIDPHFERHMPALAPAFMWILVNYYPKYATAGLMVPKVVKDYTDQYWKDNDTFKLFIEESIVQVKIRNDQGQEIIDPNVSLTGTDIYREFKQWFRDNYPGAQVPKNPTVRSELIRRLGPQRNRRWAGIRLQTHVTTLPNI